MRAKAKLITDLTLAITPRFQAVLKVYEVPPSKKFPKGIKAKYVLLDLDKGEGRLLIDNHEPFGFHIHPNMSQNHNERIPLDVSDHSKALEIFFTEVERILENE